ncbi:MAG: phosphotransferase [Neptuniibacter sp. Phe_28]|nr:MAG: phosphotransferase [Neptuniibacter sp. Phe_28]
MELPKYDLHCHTTASDGALEPHVLLARAKERQIEVLAITDHDTLAGIAQFSDEDLEGIRLISGVEFTCTWNQRVLHIVGLGLDVTSVELKDYLATLSALRLARARKVADQLMTMGLPDLYLAAKEKGGEGVIGRPHFARVMLEQGLVSTEQQAFKKYLGIGKKGDVKMEWPSLVEVLSVIKNAGGVSILAHPTKYKMTFTKLRGAINDFTEAGGDGIEVSYPGMTPDHHFQLLRIAKEKNMMISAGSDFHSPGHTWTDLGKYPPLKSNVNHVLNYLL